MGQGDDANDDFGPVYVVSRGLVFNFATTYRNVRFETYRIFTVRIHFYFLAEDKWRSYADEDHCLFRDRHNVPFDILTAWKLVRFVETRVYCSIKYGVTRRRRPFTSARRRRRAVEQPVQMK
ncbi:hypothetical protein EVAR_81964_1 [Eumeta japonica]|uniref:Uncharacterized protein n=1 Tax=Eumeta variegata TaxID=151549 RepID=A0A4C1VX51_EUMVA|nr:hypothetical protein EVAR_81964_1 [Eumeta japonica]